MKRAYELALIIRMDANQAVIDEAIDQVRTWIETDADGEITSMNRWGQRRLAYEINDQRDGYYVMITADMDPGLLSEVEENLKLSSSILRYLLVRDES